MRNADGDRVAMQFSQRIAGDVQPLRQVSRVDLSDRRDNRGRG